MSLVSVLSPLQASTPGGVEIAIQLLIALVQVAGIWAVFSKAGHAGWKALIPLYNLYIMLKIGDNAWWWLVLLFVPIVNLYAVYRINAGVGRAFGKGTLFGLGLTFLGFLFYPVLGFGDYEYKKPTGM